MRRTLPLVLIVLFLLARPAWSEDAERQSGGIDPAKVAKLLLSDDEDERARGAELLNARMRRGGDVQTWLLAMARAQAAWANADERLLERWIDDVLRGTPERAVRARRLLAALGREATQRLLQALRDVQTLLPQGEAQMRQGGDKTAPAASPGQFVGPQVDVPPPPRQPQVPQVPVAAAPVPVGRIDAQVLEIPRAEILASLTADRSLYGASARELVPLAHDQAVVVSVGADDIFASAAALPEARVRPVDPSQGFLVPGRELVLIQGDAVRYRSRARRTKGAWAVDTDTVRRGLQVGVRLEAERLQLWARYVTMPDPLPTESVRPANDVEPLELDRPEWESASMRLTTPLQAARNQVVAFFPGLMPDKVVVVSLRLLPLNAK